MKRHQSGYTLVEIIVVVAIIGVLSALAGFSAASVREDARDTKRASDIDQIGFALRLYAQERGEYPDCSGGTVLEAGRTEMYAAAACPDESDIKDYLTSYFGEIPTDPLGPGSDDYYYYYDSAHNCFGGAAAAMVFAVNLENRSTNADEVCDSQSGNDGGYLNTLNINPSQPYVHTLNRL